jgi:hypothetical protein
MMRRPRQKDKGHREFVSQLHCLGCGDNTSVEAAHIRYSDPGAGKRSTGMAEKSHDMYVLPLCGECHRKQHKMSERGFWEIKDIDPIKVALALYVNSGNHELATEIVDANRKSDMNSLD